MWTKQHKQRNTGRLIVPAIATVFLSYFGFHAYHGEYGIYSKYRLEKRIVELGHVLDDTVAERGALERKVQMLRDGTIEKDMLDEFARRELDFSRPNELTVNLQ
ncbi:MAG: septum formation initiator family protein [Rhizobiaceae bacterium]|nr:septum formation initiator family protein [Rhizobiaceae bacterium]